MTKGLTQLAKGLRKRATDVEQALWSRLRAGRFEGLKFRRQHPIGQYAPTLALPLRGGGQGRG